MPRKLDQNSNCSSKLLRLFRILLADDSKHFLGDLKEQLNCSSQTVMRLITEIENEFRDNIETGLEKGKRYYRLTSKRSEQLDLNYAELRFLSLCTDLSSKYLPDTIKKRLSSSIFEMAVQLSAIDARSLKDQEKSFSFIKKGYIEYGPHFKTIESILKAMRNRSLIKIKYKKPRIGVCNNIIYTPIKLTSMSNNTLYSLGFEYNLKNHEFTKCKCFAVHRILDIEILGIVDAAKSLPDINLYGYGLPWHKPKRFKIWFSKEMREYIEERVWSEEQRIWHNEDGSIVLEIVSSSSPEIESFILSFGGDAKLVSSEAIDIKDDKFQFAANLSLNKDKK